MVAINQSTLRRTGWILNPNSGYYNGRTLGVSSLCVTDLEGRSVVPAAGRLCTSPAVLNHGVYSDGACLLLIINRNMRK